MSELILYTTEDGRAAIQLRAEEGTVWLTQQEMAELFATSKQNISLHACNILEESELFEDSVVKESLTTASDGKRYRTKLYNLDMMLLRRGTEQTALYGHAKDGGGDSWSLMKEGVVPGHRRRMRAI